MNKKILFVITSSLLTLFSCSKEETVHTLKSYDVDTKTTDISEYVLRNGDTIFHGKFTRYNEKGDKIAEGNFINNEPHGKSIYYFENGIIKSIHYRMNSKIDTEGIWNYPSGNIERYILYDEFGSPVFIIRFDEQGNIKKEDGAPLIETYQYKIKYQNDFKTKMNQYLKVGDTLKHQYLLANIPNTRRNYKIENISLQNTKINRIITKVSPTILDVKEVLTKKGTNTIRFIVEYEFNDKDKTVQKYTLTFEVMVN